jgi:hypothetical protein
MEHARVRLRKDRPHTEQKNNYDCTFFHKIFAYIKKM